MNLNDADLRFSNRAIKRKKLFLLLSIVSVVVGLGLAVFYIWEFTTQADFPVGIHAVLVILILLTARLNLRQHLYAKILEKLIAEKQDPL